MIKALAIFFALLFCGTVAANGLSPSHADDTVLKVDEAFQLMPLEYDGKQLRVSWEIAPGHYLYRKRLEFKLLDPVAMKLPKPQLPRGIMERDEHFGKVEVYRGMTLAANFKWPKSAKTPQRLQVRYQGCADIGICYPPQTRVLELMPQ